MIFKIAWRNVARNRRRTAATMLTIAVGAAAMLVFGGFMLFSTYGLQTATVRANGHLAIYRSGYFLYGAGNPAAWGISDYSAVLDLVRKDRLLAPLVEVATPVQAISGIIANPEADLSKTFFGTGFVPSERDRMRAWNPYGAAPPTGTRSQLEDAKPAQGLIGNGLALILGLCEPLHMADCPPPKEAPEAAENANRAIAETENFDFLDQSGTGENEFLDISAKPTVQLLGATVGGAPNIVQVELQRSEYQGVKGIDDSFVGLNLTLAQQLVYGREAPKATGIVVLLGKTADLDKVVSRLAALIKQHKLDLEVKDFAELSPVYKQATGLYHALFWFISFVIGCVVVFSVGNAVGMSVVERTAEIGSLRSLGLKRSGVRNLFLAEGAMIGVLGATLGLLLTFAIAFLINRSGLSWTPPGNAQPVPIRIYLTIDWWLPALVWSGLIVVALVASVLPAYRASRLNVVDALRHV